MIGAAILAGDRPGRRVTRYGARALVTVGIALRGDGSRVSGARSAHGQLSARLPHSSTSTIESSATGARVTLELCSRTILHPSPVHRHTRNVAAAPSAPAARGGLAPAARRRVLALMAARVEQGVSVDALAREAGLSPAHFARAFTRSLGRPPHQHLLALRLERARALLEAADARLSDVALRAGFADQAHFTRAFKRAFGVTPGAVLRGRSAARRGSKAARHGPVSRTSPSPGGS